MLNKYLCNKGIVFISLVFYISLVSSLNVGDDSSVGVIINQLPTAPTNYSLVNVNNSQFLQGYTPATLPISTATQNAVDDKLDLDGGNANTDINIGAYELTAKDITITTPYNIYLLSHNSFADYSANQHIDWTSASENIYTGGYGQFGGIKPYNDVMWDSGTLSERWLTTWTTIINSGGGRDLNLTSGTGKIIINSNLHQDDNKRHYFGTADDSYIEYDGNDLIIKPDNVGSGMLNILGDINASVYTSNGSGLFDVNATDDKAWHRDFLDTGNYNTTGNIDADELHLSVGAYNDLPFTLGDADSGFYGGSNSIEVALGGSRQMQWTSKKITFAGNNIQMDNRLQVANHDTIADYVSGTGWTNFISFRNDAIANARIVLWQNVNTTKDLNVVGNFTGNQIIGGMWYHNHTATVFPFTSSDVYYTLFFTNATNLNGFGTQGIGFGLDSNLTAQVGGLYQAGYTAIGSGQNNHIYRTSIFINDVNQELCETHHKMSAGNDVVTQSGNCFIRLAVGDKVSLRTSDEGGTGDGEYYGGNINLVRVRN